MPPFSRVLITGAAGALGTHLRQAGPRLAERITLSDRVPCRDAAPHEDDRPAALADPAAVMAAAEGADAIVHLGGPATEASGTPGLHANSGGGYNISAAPRRLCVKRVVFASSIHAVGFYERTQTIDAAAPPRPDSLYGVSKTFVETLSRYYFDKFGLESVCVRIGSCFPKPVDRRHLITWISYRDLCQVVEKALAAERVGHMIAMPTSNNRASFWNDAAAASLGFRAQDSADDFRDEVLARTRPGDPDDPAIRFQGGSFCKAGHFDDPQ